MIGVALRAWAYFANTALWLDEILLSRNIIELPLRALLTEPLQLDQVAPRGFLLLEKAAVTAFGPSEYALRLLPFLAGLATLVLFWRLARHALEGWGVPIAVGLVAIGVPFVKYSAEVKQYGVDATAAVLLMLMALNLRGRDTSTRRLLLAGAAGLVIMWFSQAAVIVMAGMGLAATVEWALTRERRTLRVLLWTMPLWAVACALAVVAGNASMTPSTREFMQDFWRAGFFPLPHRSPSDLGWFWASAVMFFADVTLLRYQLPALFVVLALCGIAALWQRQRFVALLVVGPFVVAMVAALAQQYPFRGRLLLFLTPAALLAVGAGIDWTRRLGARLHPAVGVAAAALLLASPVAAVIRTPPPYDLEHNRTIAEYLGENHRPGDAVHVFPLSRIGLLFYGPRYGVEADEWITSVCDRDETRAYVRDVDQFRGRPRVWVLTSGARPYRMSRAAVRGYLATIGVKRNELSRPSAMFGNVTLELFDLSDAARLTAADAETFPVGPAPTDPRPGCRPWSKDPDRNR